MGEDYYEQALRNRIMKKVKYENEVNAKISSTKNEDSLEVIVLKTVRQYTTLFSQDILPVSRKNPHKYFSWENDENLDRIADLNKKVNDGLTLDGLRNEFKTVEKSASEKIENIRNLKAELRFFEDLLEKAKLCFEKNIPNEKALLTLAEHKITADNYLKINNLIDGNKTEIDELEKSLSEEQTKLNFLSSTLTFAEQIAGGTYVQSLIKKEIERRQAEYIRPVLKLDKKEKI